MNCRHPGQRGVVGVSVLVIRSNKRFAVCRKARLHQGGNKAEQGLIIELSLDGCRVSNLDAAAFSLDQDVTLTIDGNQPIEARIRWLGDRAAGLRFLRPQHNAALDRLIRLCRGELDDAAPVAAYGT